MIKPLVPGALKGAWHKYGTDVPIQKTHTAVPFAHK